MGVGIEELRDAVFAQPAAPAARVLELTRAQCWCVPDARKLAGRALSAGGLLVDLEGQLADCANVEGTYAYRCVFERRSQMRLIFMDALVEAITLEAEVRRPSVHEWHSRRRAAILKAFSWIIARPFRICSACAGPNKWLKDCSICTREIRASFIATL